MDAINYTTPFWIRNDTNSSNTVSIKKSNSGAPTLTVYYSKDLQTWTALSSTSTTARTVSLAAWETVYFKCTTNNWGTISGTSMYSNKIFFGSAHVMGGNIMSLLYGDNFVGKKVFPNENVECIFYALFSGNTACRDASQLVLPVTHIESTTGLMGKRCYCSMFEDCSNLQHGPQVDLRFRDASNPIELERCMERFLKGCSRLKDVHICLQNLNDCYYDIFLSTTYLDGLVWYDYSGKPISSAPASVSIVKLPAMYDSNYNRVIGITSNTMGEINSITDSNSVKIFDDIREKEYFYIENTYAGTNTITFTTNTEGTPPSGKYATSVEYSTDKVHWNTLTFNTSTPQTVQISQNQKLYLRNNTGYFSYYDNTNKYYTKISGSASHNIGGNIASLLDYTHISTVSYGIGSFAFLFSYDTYLDYATNLIIDRTYVSDWCFGQAFERSGIKEICDFNSVCNVGRTAFNGMFQHSSLVHAPDFDNLVSTGVRSAFSWYCHDCTSLVSTGSFKSLIRVGPYGFNQAFTNCTSLTTVMSMPLFSNTRLETYSFNRTFSGCTSLKNGVDVRGATTVDSVAFVQCYDDCSSLETVYAPTVSSWTTSIYSNWMRNVKANGSFYYRGSATVPTGNNGRPSSWTLVTT